MLRRITKAIGRYKNIGAVHDYPVSVWNQMAKNGKTTLDSFSEEVEFNPGLQSPLRGKPKQRARVGG